MPRGKRMKEGQREQNDKKQPDSKRDSSRISLHPLTVEEALSGLLKVRPPEKEEKKKQGKQ